MKASDKIKHNIRELEKIRSLIYDGKGVQAYELLVWNIKDQESIKDEVITLEAFKEIKESNTTVT